MSLVTVNLLKKGVLFWNTYNNSVSLVRELLSYMKKSNIIVFLALTLASIILLWQWYSLGYNHVDNPVYIAITVLWLIVIVAGIIIIVLVERNRCQRIKHVYISDELIFNYEKGSFPYNDSAELLSRVEQVLEELNYSFRQHDFPNEYAFPIRHIIRTKNFDKDRWTGEVYSVHTDVQTDFSDKEELFKILNGLKIQHIEAA